MKGEVFIILNGIILIGIIHKGIKYDKR